MAPPADALPSAAHSNGSSEGAKDEYALGRVIIHKPKLLLALFGIGAIAGAALGRPIIDFALAKLGVKTGSPATSEEDRRRKIEDDATFKGEVRGFMKTTDSRLERIERRVR